MDTLVNLITSFFYLRQESVLNVQSGMTSCDGMQHHVVPGCQQALVNLRKNRELVGVEWHHQFLHRRYEQTNPWQAANIVSRQAANMQDS